MTFKVQRGSFTKSALGAPVSQIIDTLSGLDIKYIHFWTEQQVGTGFTSENNGHTEGWSDAVNEISVGGAAEHNAADPGSERRMAALALSCIADTGSVNFEGTVTSFGTGIDAGKFTINWTTNNVAAVQIYYEAYCGDKILNVAIGTITTPSATGNEAITGIGFQPNFLQYCSVGLPTTLPFSANDGHVAIGQAVSSTQRNALAYFMEQGGADTIATQVDLLLRTLEFTGMGNNATIKEDIDFVSFDADGWTHNMVKADNNADHVGYVAVEFDSLIEIDIGVFNQPTTTGAVNTTTANKNIQAVIFRSQNRTTTGTLINDLIVRLTTGIGVLPASDEQVTGFDYDDSGGSSSLENMGATDKAIKFFEQTSTVQAEANLIDSTVDTDFRLDWTTVDATARAILYLAFSFQSATISTTHTTDSVLKKITPISHTTDSFLKALKQDTHETDSVLTKIDNELTHTTDSYLVNAKYLTHTTDSVLQMTEFQQHTTDSVLVAIDNEITHTTDSVIKKLGIEITHTTDSAITKLGIEITHTTDSVLGEREPGFAITHTTDSYLIDRDIEITHTTDSYLLDKVEITHTTDSVLGEREPGFTIAHTTDSYLIDRDIEITHTTDSYLLDKVELTHTTDSILLAILTRTHTTDSVLGEREPGFTIAHTTDSYLIDRDIELTHTTDSYLIDRDIELDHTTDSILLAIITRTHTTDSVLGEREPGFTRTHTTDSYLINRDIEITHTTDSYLIDRDIELDHTTDSILLAILTRTHTTDSVLGEREPGFTIAHTTDSYLINRDIELTHTTDSYLINRDIEITHTTDSVLGEREPGFAIIHTTDSAITKLGIEITHTTDSVLGEREPGFTIVHTTDSVLRDVLTRNHTTDSVLKLLGIEISHTTDSVCGERLPGISITHTTDSVLKAIGLEVSHTTDSFFFQKFVVSHTTDSFFFKKVEVLHTTDSIARKKLTNSHTTDSILGERLPGISVVHSTDSDLKLNDNQLCHFTDSLLRRTRWPQKEDILVFIPNTDVMTAVIQQEYPQSI